MTSIEPYSFYKFVMTYVLTNKNQGVQSLKMSKEEKNNFIQIRVSDREKKAILKSAKLSGFDISGFILSKCLSPIEKEFLEITQKLHNVKKASFILAELHDFLQRLNSSSLKEAVKTSPDSEGYYRHYVAAMVETACDQKNILPPQWVSESKGLETPVFGTDLNSLRFYLLTHSPIPFRKRNIFIDSTLGSRV